ncbi:hypothetical protein HMPREF1052_2224 [Pasteurella bettyae CCUG 2042]|uniref:D12 class N6 adenine-specific DNA methyltransferase n=1 Tax=Pasteurella bettyae CCUG 2042 TaxID=1095749 RepID=I3DC13_9PAST|nr:hypothetical protein [Pasteurella bettyae]EIJ69256.1 hypothetical protein HMPREF1052_2224 [Pasteurella bettyae CCUG 2042]
MFKQAPIPFIGQKRMFLQHFERLLNDNIPNDGDGWTIVDAFGGSGLLSHIAKRLKPKATVIYNDFDGYAERLQHIDDINRLRRQIAPLLALAEQPKQKRLSPELKAQIIDVIKAFDGYINVHVLCSWLLFSGQQVKTLDELFTQDFWHCLRQSDYPSADGYLDGLTVVSESFHTLLPKYQHDPKALFVLDPPYLCTHQESYGQQRYFDLIDFLRLIHLTRPPFVFFSSTKSEFVRFIDAMITDQWDKWQSFANYERIAVKTSTSYSGKYEDNMVYKF